MQKIKSTNSQYLNQYTRDFRGVIFLLCFLSTISSVGFVALALFTKNIVNIATHQTIGSLTTQFVASGITLAVITLCSIFSGLISNKWSAQLTNRISLGLWQNLIKKTYTDISSRHSSEFVHLFSSDIDIISSNYISILPNIFSSFVKIILGTIVIAWINIYFALICVAIGLLVATIVSIYRKPFKKAQLQSQSTRATANSIIQESISNIEAIKPLQLQDKVQQNLQISMNNNYLAKLRRGKIAIIINSLIFLIFNISFYIAIGLGAYSISKGTMLMGELFALVQLLQIIKSPFNEAIGIVPQYVALNTSTSRIMSIDNMSDDQDYSASIDDFDNITIADLAFGYKDKEIFHNFSLDITKGDKIGIIGYSGCGKSTLAKILVNLLPAKKGKISLKSNNLEYDYIPSNLISYVPQSNIIFSGTIQETLQGNIKDIDQATFEKACNIACVSDFVKELPNGYDTYIGEKGYGLSQGQNARLSIARALIKDTPIIIMDEITASLDKATSQKLLKNLCSIKSKTFILITHSDMLTELCTKVVNMENYRC